MAKLTGIGIYKLLPKTNCGECNFPTCMAFAMQVAAKKVALEACPYVSEDAKRELAESAAPSDAHGDARRRSPGGSDRRRDSAVPPRRKVPPSYRPGRSRSRTRTTWRQKSTPSTI